MNKQDFNKMPLGWVRVIWKSGGHSQGCVNQKRNGKRRLMLANWINATINAKSRDGDGRLCRKGIERVDKVDDDVTLTPTPYEYNDKIVNSEDFAKLAKEMGVGFSKIIYSSTRYK